MTNKKYRLFTSESVCAGHPDKICDTISDAVVDAILEQDKAARIAVDVAIKDRIIMIGEVSSRAKVDYEMIARDVVERAGYINEDWGFWHESPVEIHINQQSSEIAQGVTKDQGAGDQGMMFGYACLDTVELMPMPIVLAHQLTKRIDEARESGKLNYLRPDGKAQVTVRYYEEQPVGVEKVIVAVPHSEDVELEQVKSDLIERVLSPLLAKHGYEIDEENVIVNGTGAWHIPGPANDAGMTGRKVIVDGYGSMARVGGGAFSGKDPSKVDRSGAYAARYLAKNIVAAGLASRAEVALAYCIGYPYPIMQTVDTFGTAKVEDEELEKFMEKTLDTSVKGIIDGLELRQPIYTETATYGHFGRPEFPWEKVVSAK